MFYTNSQTYKLINSKTHNRRMTEDELEEMMRLLEEQGWQPRVCDVEVPVYGNQVPCGLPSDVGDVLVERHLSLPHNIVRSIKAYVIQAKGNSMEDMGICNGDEVLVELCDTACDNEAVLVTLDGEMMIKLFVRDERGEVWLVPRNRAFRPIHVREGMELRIRARVLKVLKDTLRAPFGEIQACISEAAKQERQEREQPKGKGRPKAKELESLFAEKCSTEQRERLMEVLQSHKGKELMMLLNMAYNAGWLMEMPSYVEIKKLNKDIGAKSNYYDYRFVKMTEEEMAWAKLVLAI